MLEKIESLSPGPGIGLAMTLLVAGAVARFGVLAVAGRIIVKLIEGTHAY